MIERYSRKEIKNIWAEENKYKIWLDIELAAAEAMEKYKIIPKGVVKKVKSKAKINSGLHVHTCYSYQGSIAVDQGFNLFKLDKGQFLLPAFDVCMEADSNTASASLRLSECQDEELQKFEWDNNGRIYLTGNTELCLTVAQGKSRKGGGGSPVHLMRNLSLELCGDTLQAFQMWGARSER